jgi:cobalt-zinc-cadmium efflux system outer membrane protein
METQKSESDQALDNSAQFLRQARVALAFLLGVRGEVPNFDVDTHVIDYSVPSGLADSTEVGLLRTAFTHRPDLIAAGYNIYSAEAALALVKRQKFPDIALSLGYTGGGLGAASYGGSGTNGPPAAPTVTFGLAAPLPVFYQLQGETKQAEATLDSNALQHALTTKQVVSDVDVAYSSVITAQKLVNRMEKGEPEAKVRPILESSKVALDITRLQWERGAASLTDFLLALQTYIATKVEYYGDLTSYWTAVYQLEEAIGTELRR